MLKLEVPEHILDMVAERTAAYMRDSYDRAFGAAGDLSREEFDKASTHNVVNTSERRELHRQILTTMMENGLGGEKPEKPLLIYFAGPMAAGKSTLRGLFDGRIAEEQRGNIDASYADGLEAVYQSYKSASAYKMDSDFQFYKERLPEFAGHGENFGVIRAEASALDQACAQLALEMGSSLILEQLCDGDQRETMRKFNKDYDVVVIGVTAPPAVNACRLLDRNEETGQEISLDELARSIVGCSDENAIPHMAGQAVRAVLVSSADGFEPIAVWEGGKLVAQNAAKCEDYDAQSQLDAGLLAESLKQAVGLERYGESQRSPGYDAS